MNKTETELEEKTNVTDKVSYIHMKFPKGIQREQEVNLQSMLDEGGEGEEEPEKKPNEEPEDKNKKPEDKQEDPDEGGEEEEEGKKGGEEIPAVKKNKDGSYSVDFLSDELPLDDEGNLLGLEGEVIMNKEDFEAKKAEVDQNGEEEDKNKSSIEHIRESVGVQPLDENGAPKVYENTVDGIASYIKDVTETNVEKRLVDEQKKFLESNPYLLAYYEHLASGGNPLSFTGEVKTYQELEYKDDDATQQFDLIKANLIRTGHSEEDAAAMAKTLADADAKKHGKAAYDALVKAEKTEREAAVEKQKQIEQKRKDDDDKYWKGISDTINSGKIGNLSIPEERQKEFLEYVTKPVTEEGYTREALSRLKRTTDQHLQIALLDFLGWDIKKLVEHEAKRQRVLVIKAQAGQPGLMKKGSSTEEQEAFSTTEKITLTDVLK